jgi:hypothetical protein
MMKEPVRVLALAGEASSAATTAEIEIGARALAQVIFISFPFCYYRYPAGVPAGAGFTAANWTGASGPWTLHHQPSVHTLGRRSSSSPLKIRSFRSSSTPPMLNRQSLKCTRSGCATKNLSHTPPTVKPHSPSTRYSSPFQNHRAPHISHHLPTKLLHRLPRSKSLHAAGIT